MRWFVVVAVWLGCIVFARADGPEFVIDERPSKRVEAVLTLEINCPKVKAKEWVLYALGLPELPGQSDLKARMAIPFETISDLSAYKRPLVRGRVKVKTADQLSQMTVQVIYAAQLASRRLVPAPKFAAAPKVKALSAAERKLFTAKTSLVQFDDNAFKAYLRESKLLREKEESDLNYGKRVFLHVAGNFGYEYVKKMDRKAASVCKAGKSDCGGLSIAIVAALRSHGIPARLRAGRWAVSSKKGELLGEVPWSQQHTWGEYYCEAIGWVPFDPAAGILSKRPENGFGNDTGNFITLHVDHDVYIDSIFAGKQMVPWLQTVAYWIQASGSVEGATHLDTWQVREIK